jgi:hypothetical protein
MSPQGEVFPLGSLGMPVPSVGIALCLRHACAVARASGGGDTGMPVARLTQERQSGDKDCSALTHLSGISIALPCPHSRSKTRSSQRDTRKGQGTAVAGLSENPQGPTASTDRCLTVGKTPGATTGGTPTPDTYGGKPSCSTGSATHWLPYQERCLTPALSSPMQCLLMTND